MDFREAMRVVRALNDIERAVKRLIFWIAISAIWICIAIIATSSIGG